ncbi:hypothetical protein KQI68_07415 [Peptoniphilus sp. MSJ-1]|uniref:Uncharacterized protein n=1 Tax=Peptoniphilus ovalis TaxID=2841503 RepID=A0ABS6FHL2_9FIRM|nr:hypothetical protein [Peptoniphilus ovalis]MBU5669668.1 hypothetical protein [Peptoniphilus ovalis]
MAYLDKDGLLKIASYFKDLRSKLNNKVDKINGKSLSSNDFTDTHKNKIDAIPSNPKYTDTVTTVENVLTSTSTSNALSANQGKILNDSLSNKADKSNVSRCKTKGYPNASSWQSVSNMRDVEDWIGDFDKRTRELKDSGGGSVETDSFRGAVCIKMGKIASLYVDPEQADSSFMLRSKFLPSSLYWEKARYAGSIPEIGFNVSGNANIGIRKDGTVRMYGSANAAVMITYFTD